MAEKKEALTRPERVLLEWIQIVFCTAPRHLFRIILFFINLFRAYTRLVFISLCGEDPRFDSTSAAFPFS